MQRLNTDQLANRVMAALLTALALSLVFWGVRRWGEPAPALPSASDYFDQAASRAAASTDGLIAELQTRLTAHPDDWVVYGQLGAAYLQKARETADPAFYQTAEAALQTTLTHAPGDYLALGKLGELALARHDFAGALALGERARDLNPSRSFAYGVIADAQIELGHYDEAARTLQTMVDLRPDLNSYSRISYLRELHGDVEGALEAMRLAVDAGGPAAENTFWTRTQLGHLYFHNGRLAEAEQEYQRLLAADPAYVPALAGLARVRAAQGEFDGAIELYSEVTARMPLAEYVIALGDVYAAAGRAPEADRQYALARAIDQLYRANGVNTDLELALFLADHGSEAEVVTAVARAREAYRQRPTVQAAEVLAWALYQAGDAAEARGYAQEALRLGAQDALKHFRAGVIEYALGNHAPARAHLEQALAINPYFSVLHAAEARALLLKLR